jgi:hypothetical protein
MPETQSVAHAVCNEQVAAPTLVVETLATSSLKIVEAAVEKVSEIADDAWAGVGLSWQEATI